MFVVYHCSWYTAKLLRSLKLMLFSQWRIFKTITMVNERNWFLKVFTSDGSSREPRIESSRFFQVLAVLEYRSRREPRTKARTENQEREPRTFKNGIYRTLDKSGYLKSISDWLSGMPINLT